MVMGMPVVQGLELLKDRLLQVRHAASKHNLPAAGDVSEQFWPLCILRRPLQPIVVEFVTLSQLHADLKLLRDADIGSKQLCRELHGSIHLHSVALLQEPDRLDLIRDPLGARQPLQCIAGCRVP